jgi:hypothetical protein
MAPRGIWILVGFTITAKALLKNNIKTNNIINGYRLTLFSIQNNK